MSRMSSSRLRIRSLVARTSIGGAVEMEGMLVGGEVNL